MPENPVLLVLAAVYKIVLRDYFAGQVLTGMMSQWAVADNQLPEYGDCAAHAYRIATAMLKAREADHA